MSGELEKFGKLPSDLMRKNMIRLPSLADLGKLPAE
jgi:hypothetical protein